MPIVDMPLPELETYQGLNARPAAAALRHANRSPRSALGPPYGTTLDQGLIQTLAVGAGKAP